MSTNVESISSRELVLWRPRADAMPWIAPALVLVAALATYEAMPLVALLANSKVPALPRTFPIPQTKQPDRKAPAVETAPPANPATVTVPPQDSVATARQPVTINVPPQDVVVVAVPPHDPIVITDKADPVNVVRKPIAAPLKSAEPSVHIARHAAAPHVRHHRVVVETKGEPLRHVVRESDLREVAALAPRPVPTPGLFPLPLKIFLADIFGTPRP